MPTVGSDAHSYSEVGKSTMYMQDYVDSDGFVTNLNDAILDTNSSSPLVHLASRWAVLVRKMNKD